MHARPRKALGYCWHGYIAWRGRPSGELISARGVDRDEHLVMIQASQKREPQNDFADSDSPVSSTRGNGGNRAR